MSYLNIFLICSLINYAKVDFCTFVKLIFEDLCDEFKESHMKIRLCLTFLHSPYIDGLYLVHSNMPSSFRLYFFFCYFKILIIFINHIFILKYVPGDSSSHCYYSTWRIFCILGCKRHLDRCHIFTEITWGF